jgi:hypothetical protein
MGTPQTKTKLPLSAFLSGENLEARRTQHYGGAGQAVAGDSRAFGHQGDPLLGICVESRMVSDPVCEGVM